MPADSTPPPSIYSTPAVRWLTADAGDDMQVVLTEDSAHGVLKIAFECADQRHRLNAAVQTRENWFEAVPATDGKVWGHQHDRGARFQDRMDAEWVCSKLQK